MTDTGHPLGIVPISDRLWERADIRLEFGDGTRTAIWAPDNLADYGIAQSERPPSHLSSKDAIHNNAIIASRIVHGSPIGGLLNELRFQVWSEINFDLEQTLTHFASAGLLEALVRRQNQYLTPDHQLVRIAPQPGSFFPTRVMAECLAEDEPGLPISNDDLSLLVHDTALHVTAWMATPVSARLAGRNHARAVLRGEVPFDPTLPEKAGDNPVDQLGYRLDTRLNALLINEKSIVEPQGFGAHGLSAAIAQRGVSQLAMAYTVGFGVDRLTANQLVSDTWAHTAYMYRIFGAGE